MQRINRARLWKRQNIRDRRNNYSMFVLVLTNRVGVNEYNDEGKCLRVISIKHEMAGGK